MALWGSRAKAKGFHATADRKTIAATVTMRIIDPSGPAREREDFSARFVSAAKQISLGRKDRKKPRIVCTTAPVFRLAAADFRLQTLKREVHPRLVSGL